MLVPFFERSINERLRVHNICVMHFGRCGSSVVGALLGQHRKVHWDGEYLGRLEKKGVLSRQNDPDSKRLELVNARMYTKRESIYGLEVKPVQLRSDRSSNVMSFLEGLFSIGFSSLILLKRDNYLRRIVSHQQLLKTRVLHRQTESTKVVNTYLDPSETTLWSYSATMLEVFQYMDEFYEALAHFGSKEWPGSFLELTYEKHIENNPYEAYERVCNKHKIKTDFSASIQLRKTNPFPLSEVIINYQEIVEILRGTRYEWMLTS